MPPPVDAHLDRQQRLATQDKAGETGTVRQAKAVLEDAKLKRDRAAKLVQQGITPRAEYDTVDSEYKVALDRKSVV